MKLKWFAASLAICASLATAAAKADVTFTPSADLKAKGVKIDNVEIISFSPDGKMLAGYSHGTNEDVAAGKIFTLFTFDIDAKGKIGKVNSYPLNIATFEQACFTPDGKSIVIISKSGAEYLKQNLETGEQTVIMDHKYGKPGFRAYPTVLQLSDGKMLASGFFYDDKDFTGTNCVAILDPDKQGAEAFTEAMNVESIEKSLNSTTQAYPRADLGFIGAGKSAAHTLYKWKAGDKTAEPFEKNIYLLGLWASDKNLLYSVKRGDKQYELSVYNALDGKKTVLDGSSTKPYQYVFLSADGKTAIANIEDRKTHRMNIFWAREDEGWELKPIKGLKNGVSTGSIRVTPDGSKIVHQTEKGLRVIDVE